MERRVWMIGSVAGLVAAGVLAGVGGMSRQPEGSGSGAAGELVEAPDGAGAAHAALAELVGEWESVSVFSMPGAEGPGAEGEAEGERGTARIETILGGVFIAIHESGTMMGEAFESMKVFGFNNAAGIYESTWMYTGSTAMLRMRGTSEDGGVITVYQAQYATTSEENQRFLVTMSLRGPDRFVVGLAALMPDGSAGPALETTYTRRR